MTSDSVKMQDIFEAYLEALETNEPERLATRRSHLRNISKHLDCSETAGHFVDAVNERIAQYILSVPKRGSHAPAISTLRMALRWAYSEKLIAVIPSLAESLGMPPVAVFSNWREFQKAPAVYKALLSEMKIAQLMKDDLEESFFEKFLAGIPDHLGSWRSGWREFRICWEEAAEEGLVPEVDLPEAPSRRRESYAIREVELPPALAQELWTVRRRLEGERLVDRQGVQPYDESTVELLIGSLFRLAGFLLRERDYDLATSGSLRELLTVQHGLELMNHVNNQWLDEHDIAAEQRHNFGLGVYEIGLLHQFAALARVGLHDHELYRDYVAEIKYRSQQVQIRREREKNHGRLDDYFHVSLELVRRALSGESGLGEIRRAILIRDALAFTLFASFGYRIGVLASLKLEEHVRRGQDREILICIRKEATKPARRDLIHEVPSELIPLFEYYLNNCRKALLRGGRDHGALFVSFQDGRHVSASAIYGMFVAQTWRVLGEIHNPHQVRKAWATDFARWTKGDYVTASSILDTSPLTLQKHYVKIVREEQINDFDEATRAAWIIAEGSCA